MTKYLLIKKLEGHKVSFLVVISLSLIIIYHGNTLQKTTSTESTGITTVAFLDVGQGDATLITMSDQKQILIDTSAESIITRKLSSQMNYFDKSIDLVISTHADQDHIGGLPDVIKKFQIDGHIYNFIDENSGLVKEINTLSEKHKINQINLHAGDRIILNETGNFYIDILWPTDKITNKDKNNNSIVTKIVLGDISFMLTGDVGVEVEKTLLTEFGESLKSQVLKLGHHGSKTSTSPEFLEMVQPQFAIISAGKDNRYGHPHQEVMDNLEKYTQSINEKEKRPNEGWILNTFDNAVVFKTDGESVWFVD